MHETTVSFDVKAEVTPAFFPDLLTFIYQNYILPHIGCFTNIAHWSSGERHVLSFTFLDSEGRWYVDVQVEASDVIHVDLKPSSPAVPRDVLNRLREDLIIYIQHFEEKVRRTTIYFAFVKSREIMLERRQKMRRKALSQIFFGNMLALFMIFILISYLVFLVFQMYTPIILVLSQLIIILFADKIMMKVGDWPITSDNPDVYILQYHIPPEEFNDFIRRFSRETLLEIKRKIYERTLAVEDFIDVRRVLEVFREYGIKCDSSFLSTKKINVYRLVKEAAERFNIPMPKIMIANVIIPNAGATGPSPSRGLILITSGLLVQLEEDEILSIIGHEISHLKRRDPLALFALTSTEYLLRVYVLLRYIFYFGFLYFFVAISGIYFIAKFFEARADLESAIRIGKPKVLADALRKIGFRRIQVERMEQGKWSSWLGMDPHPPVSFRVSRLENLEDPSRIKYPFIRSIIDCVNGLLGR